MNNRIEKRFSFFNATFVDIHMLEGIQQLLRPRPSALQAQQSERGWGMTLHEGSWRAATTQVYPGLECIHVVLAVNQAEQGWDLDTDKSIGYIFLPEPKLPSERKKV